MTRQFKNWNFSLKNGMSKFSWKLRGSGHIEPVSHMASMDSNWKWLAPWVDGCGLSSSPQSLLYPLGLILLWCLNPPQSWSSPRNTRVSKYFGHSPSYVEAQCIKQITVVIVNIKCLLCTMVLLWLTQGLGGKKPISSPHHLQQPPKKALWIQGRAFKKHILIHYPHYLDGQREA